MRLYNFINEEDYTRTRIKLTTTLLEECKFYLDLIGVKSSHFDDKNYWFDYNMPKLFRGTQEKIDKAKIFTLRKRKPLGTNSECFKEINIWLNQNGHVTRDMCVSTTSNSFVANAFGSPYLFFPKGKFNYTYVKAADFNSDDTHGWDAFAMVWLLRDKLMHTPFGGILYFDQLPSNIDPSEWSKNQYKLTLELSHTAQPKARFKVSNIRNGSLGKYKVDTKANWDKRANKLKDYFISNTNITEALKKEYEIWFDCNEYYMVNPNFIIKNF